MIYQSIFRPDLTRSAEWLACLWQGPAPAGLKVREWLTLKDVKPHTAILIWEGDDEAKAFIERVFGSFGNLETCEVSSSSGMAAAFARDIDSYENMMKARGAEPAEIARQVDLRRRAMASPDQETAVAAAAAWKAEA